MRRSGFAIAITVLSACGSILAGPTYDQRIEAERKLRQVEYSHQIDASRPFEVAVPRALLERAVDTYLRQSVLLEERWHTPVTAGMLERELQRMLRGTRMPERLAEMFAALDHDPALIAECLARPLLVDRLARGFLAFDPAVHAAERARAESLRLDLAEGRLDPKVEHPARATERISRSAVPELEVGSVGPLDERVGEFSIAVALAAEDDGADVEIARYTVPKRGWDEWWPGAAARIDLARFHQLGEVASMPLSGESFESSVCLTDDTWDNGALGVPDGREGFSSLWTGSEMIVWGGEDAGGFVGSGARYDPVTDSWTAVGTVGAPSPRAGHVAVWTGEEMLIWGGGHQDGARYDPTTDTWTPMSAIGAPQSAATESAAWTGSKMLVWGTVGTSVQGGIYDPAANAWQSMSNVGAPSARSHQTAVWTGSRFIVWGGSFGSTFFNTGGVYDPGSDTWTPTSSVGAPDPRRDHSAVWTGTKMIVWGGNVPGPGNDVTGGLYDPETDTWEPTSVAGAPAARELHTAIWTGDRMVVWGGGTQLEFLNDGARYDPEADAWSSVAAAGAPTARVNHRAVWTGTEMIVWGGNYIETRWTTGGRYDPASDTWAPTSVNGAPSARAGHSTVWTGNRVIVWGGFGDVSGGILDSGGRYDPSTDSWQPTSGVGAPAPRLDHTAVWTGDEMIVWGGDCCSGKAGYNDGGRYDPATDTWTSMTLSGAPSGRYGHTAVWTGTEMIVWGGGPGLLNSGGRYRPSNNTWTATTTSAAPIPRFEHTAVWTGSRMIVWGGNTNLGFVNTGGIYDPALNSWSPITQASAPSGRWEHTAVWTGTEMIVWGGSFNSDQLDTGGRYSPSMNSWTATSTIGAPGGRELHSAVWTGNRMIVWGGLGDVNVRYNDGALYDPSMNTWTPLSLADAPTPRLRHEAVWTGSFMVVWGGAGPLLSGGRYALGHGTDDDGDGLSECGGDCNDAAGTVFAAPGAISGVLLSKNQLSGAVIQWQTDAPNSGAGTVYDVLRGTIVTLPDWDEATCLWNEVPGPSAAIPQNPPQGAGYYYLVRGHNVCAAGSWGQSSDGTERTPLACP